MTSVCALLDVTDQDIAQLDDGALRELVGRLCEAECSAAGISTAGIIWGGNQDAPDGGFDVCVNLNGDKPPSEYLSAGRVVFQVKKPSMPRGAITSEMCPKGDLREGITELISGGGKYIIVSSGDSVPEQTGFKSRLEAMKGALSELNKVDENQVDFLDRSRLATWARCYAPVMVWVLDRVAKRNFGWKSYGNWASGGEKENQKYLVDDEAEARLVREIESGNVELSVLEGIAELRSILSKGGNAVRLVGLSGVGKTRLIQALFEKGVGAAELPPQLAIYTDIASNPQPIPTAFSQQLLALQERAILIVDNCSQSLHRQLQEICSQSGSQISLLTVEYDVRDETPIETNVFRLEPSSPELISTLLKRLFPNLGDQNAERVGRISGGNFRIGIAIAKTVQRDETLGVLKDSELFERLFHQRDDKRQDLLDSGKLLSLLYSFDGVDVKPMSSELAVLASLGEITPIKLYQHVQELSRRELVQSRDKWRAVLPHAIANWLAKQLLQELPQSTIIDAILGSNNERLIRSFSRRLGYLHDSDEAVAIFETILKEDGWLGQHLHSLSSYGMDLVRNLAPLSPDLLLTSLKNLAEGLHAGDFYSNSASRKANFVGLLKHLAYEESTFGLSFDLLTLFAVNEESSNHSGSARNTLGTLCHIVLSGTMAPVELRNQKILGLLCEADEKKQKLGFELLHGALQTRHFVGDPNGDFGARPRGYGWLPRYKEDESRWYCSFLNLIKDHLDTPHLSDQLKRVLAAHFRGLWRLGYCDALEELTQACHETGGWVEGWGAARLTLYYDSQKIPMDQVDRLKNLIAKLVPATLPDRIRAYVTSHRNSGFDPEWDSEDFKNDREAARRQTSEIVRKLGEEASQNFDTFAEIAPVLVSRETTRAFHFGVGLGRSGERLSEIWDILHQCIGKIEPKNRDVSVLCGLLQGANEKFPEFVKARLDASVHDDILRKYLVTLQAECGLAKAGLARLHEALDRYDDATWGYSCLGYGRKHQQLSDDELQGLLEKTKKKPDGAEVAIKILGMRFYQGSEWDYTPTANFKAFCRELLLRSELIQGQGDRSMRDHDMSTVIQICFEGNEATDHARELGNLLNTKDLVVVSHRCLYQQSLEALAEVQPLALLETWFGEHSEVDDPVRARPSALDENEQSFLVKIDETTLFDWANESPITRFPKLAWSIPMMVTTGKVVEWHPWALRILGCEDSAQKVIEVLAHRLYPMSWAGSLSQILETRITLLQLLKVPERARLKLAEIVANFEKSIEHERKSEAEDHRRQNQSFE